MKNQRGSVTLLALTVLVFSGILLSGVLTSVTNDVTGASANEKSSAAYYIAETGAQRAIDAFVHNSQDWSWLTVDQSSSTTCTLFTYNVRVMDQNNSNLPISNGTAPIVNHTYLVSSTGTFTDRLNRQTTRTVNVIINVTGSTSSGGSGSGGATLASSVLSGNLFADALKYNYSAFSAGSMTIDNNPKITGNVASNGSITINSSSRIFDGTVYSGSGITPKPGDWNYNAAGTYAAIPEVATLNVTTPDADANIVSKATAKATGTSLPTTSATLASGTYYYDGNYSIGGKSLTFGDNSTIYVYGNLNLTSQSISSLISGNNIKIYATGNVSLDNASSISAGSGTVSIYAGGSFSMTNTSTINASHVLIEANGNVNLNSSSSINKTNASGVTELYSNGSVELTNNFTIGGTGLVVANPSSKPSNALNLNSSVNAAQTIFVSGSNTQISSTYDTTYTLGKALTVAGVYSLGTTAINTTPVINYGSATTAALTSLGLAGGSGSGSSTTNAVTVATWSIQ